MVEPPVVLSVDCSPTPVGIAGGVAVVFGVTGGVSGPSSASGNDRRLLSLSGASPLPSAASVRTRI